MITRKQVFLASAVACSSLACMSIAGLSLAAEPLSSAGLSESYVSDQPPRLTPCQAATQQPASGQSGGTGAAPCPIINDPVVDQGLSDDAVQQSLAGIPRTLPTQEIQNMEAARQVIDAFLLQQETMPGSNGMSNLPPSNLSIVGPGNAAR